MKIAIFGSAKGGSKTAIHKAQEIGKLIAKKGHSIITGACPGLPYEASKAAFKIGGKTIAYSPAKHKKEHTNKFNAPTKHFSILKFIPNKYEHRHNKSACYKYRNISSTLHADKAIIIGGGIGTLNEFTIAYDLGMEIGVLTKTNGIADMIKQIVKKTNKVTGAKVYYSSNPETLLKKMKI